MIKTEVRGIEEVKAYLKSLPYGVIKIAVPALADYLLGNERRGLRHSPPRVNHGPGRPYKWNSEKQRRAFFATKGFGGGIPYSRTNKLADGWKQTKDPYKKKLYNRVAYSQFVVGDAQQRGHAADKWRKVAQIVSDNLTGAYRSANQAVTRWLKTKGKA
jgi:hypothetical protein